MLGVPPGVDCAVASGAGAGAGAGADGADVGAAGCFAVVSAEQLVPILSGVHVGKLGYSSRPLACRKIPTCACACMTSRH